MLPGHGAVWTGNKCILEKSLNIGNPGDGIVNGCRCPGNTSSMPKWNATAWTTDTWRAQCGLELHDNVYVLYCFILLIVICISSICFINYLVVVH
jgi:hypothetical protein